MITDYWELCPQSRLYYKNKEPCTDFEAGERCVECLASMPNRSIGLNDKLLYSFASPALYQLIDRPLDKLRRLRKLVLRMRLGSKNGSINRTRVRPSYPASAYDLRRQYFVRMLNTVDVIHVESRYVKGKLVSYGIDESLIKILGSSRGYFDSIQAKPLRQSSHPIVFGCLGGINERKGIYVLLEAFSKLDQEKARLLIFGGGDSRKLKAYKHLNIHYGGSYLFRNINKVLSQIDIGIVPSIWEEVLCVTGLDFLQAKIPVIATNRGGTSEWLRDGVNGYFFDPSDPDDLFEKMNRFLEKPESIALLQRSIKPWKSLQEHTQDILMLYEELIAQ